jgi:Uma2 family endonuclease
VRQPDLVVAPSDTPGRSLTAAPLLAVEVLSPSSAERDLVSKRSDYLWAGLDHYWVVDPEPPQIAVFRRNGDALDVVAHVRGDEEMALDEPFPVRLRPSALLSGGRRRPWGC